MKSPEPIRRSATLVGHGHPEITAKHSKTFELTSETDISRRASCVVGVGTRFDDDSLVDWSLLRGRVRLTLTATAPDGTVHTAAGEAVVNPRHNVSDRIVIRRSPLSPDTADDDFTWATDSTLTSTDLDAAFTAALTDPGTRIAITADEIGARRPLILILDGWPKTEFTGRARALWTRAAIVRGDLPIRAGAQQSSAAGRDVRGDVPIRADSQQTATARGKGAKRPGSQRAGEWAGDLPDPTDGDIVAVVLDSLTEPPVPSVAAYLDAVSRETSARFAILPAAPGPLVAVEALLAVGLSSAPYAWLGSPQRLSQLPPMATVFRMPEGVAPEIFGDRRVAVAETAEQDLGTLMTWLPPEEAVTRVGALTVTAPAGDSGELVDLHTIAKTLAAAGIAPRTLSEALAPFGLTRKKLYALLKDDE